jgi:hypothetical protein
MNTASVSEFIRSRQFVAIIIAVAMLAAIAGAYSIGMAVGYGRARHSYEWGENYSEVFAGPRNGFVRGFARDVEGRDFIEVHGTFGQIIKLDGGTVLVSGRDGAEKAVVIGPETIVRRFRDDVPASELRSGDFIVVVGTPDGVGRIQAQLIRIMPPMPPSSGTLPPPGVMPGTDQPR